jgi:hypothetical protein
MASQFDSSPGRRRAQATSFPRRADDPVVLVGRGVAETMLVSYKALALYFLGRVAWCFFGAPGDLKS